MSKFIIAFITLLTASSAFAQSRRSLKDIDKELKQTKSTATAMALIESIAETTPQTDEDVATLGQLMDKYPTQGQKALAGIKDPKLAKAVMKECDRQAKILKAARTKAEKNLTDEDRWELLNSYVNITTFMRTLGTLKNKDTIPGLRTYLNEPDLSYDASTALAKIGDDEILQELFRKNSEGKRINLAAYGATGLAELVRKYDDPTYKGKGRLLEHLAGMGGRTIEEKNLLKEIILKHQDAGLRREAGMAMVHSFMNRQDTDDVDFLLEWTRDIKDPRTIWALYAIEKRWDKRLLPVTLKFLKESAYGSDRANAARILGQNQVKEAVPYLEEALMDKDSAVRSSALGGLRKIFGKDYKPKHIHPDDANLREKIIPIKPRVK